MNAENNNIDALSSGSDALSSILGLFNLDASIYYNGAVCGDWRVSEHSLGVTCFHMVTLGSCLLEVPGHYSGGLHCGDLVIFPRELPHSMIPVQPTADAMEFLEFTRAMEQGATGLLCGEMRFQHRGSSYILDALPPLFIIRYEHAGKWLQGFRDLIIEENLRASPASNLLLNKLSELLFIYALREYLLHNAKEVGLLALYGHPRLARAVAAFHHSPTADWSLETLASEAAMSRTTFAETFKAVSGWTAGQYLTWWRMQLAWSQLSVGEPIAKVALAVGYQSESAFSRAFTRTFSLPPGKVRKMNLPATL